MGQHQSAASTGAGLLAGAALSDPREDPGETPASSSAEQPPQSIRSALRAPSPDRSRPRRTVAFELSVSTSTGEREPLKEAPPAPARGMDPWSYSAPWGYRLLERVTGGRGFSLRTNRFIVLALTFLCYTSYHASRKPPSIVKAVLYGSVASGNDPTAPRHLLEAGAAFIGNATISAEDAAGWAPFNDPKYGKALLGALDLSFLAAYAGAQAFKMAGCWGVS